jgi:hypothetical protein
MFVGGPNSTEEGVVTSKITSTFLHEVRERTMRIALETP